MWGRDVIGAQRQNQIQKALCRMYNEKACLWAKGRTDLNQVKL